MAPLRRPCFFPARAAFKGAVLLAAALTSGAASGATLSSGSPIWRGGVELLSEAPPIYLLRGLLSGAEAERLLTDYDVELLPEFTRSAMNSSSPAFKRCLQRFPKEACASVSAGEIQTDPELYNSQVMAEVQHRVAGFAKSPQENVEATWLFNREAAHQGLGLHLDNHHHFMFPRRAATVVVALRQDPIGFAFPLAKLRAGSHPLAEDGEFVSKLQAEARLLPFRGNSARQSLNSGSLQEALRSICRSSKQQQQHHQPSPIRLRQGDALLYYNLDADGEVDIRALHSSCLAASPDSRQFFMANFVRTSSLLNLHRSVRTPHPIVEMHSWIGARRADNGLDAGAVWVQGEELGVLDGVDCPPSALLSMVRPGSAPGEQPALLCRLPQSSEFVVLQPGEAFEVQMHLGNVGRKPWPEGSVLSLRGGQALGAPAGIRVPQQVPVGSTVNLVLDLTAPEQPGTRAHAVWSLADALHVPFGVLLWVDLAVAVVHQRSCFMF
ncbi:unnamed protein product [Polarella glacialis]|uniref:Nbr1 FW domain-containing protein n=1 Tax=Polarella glacialis TaxID=89957 RepID=A0A813HF92_POLGL|nr:unnamed protein product [Polarella glacialis]